MRERDSARLVSLFGPGVLQNSPGDSLQNDNSRLCPRYEVTPSSISDSLCSKKCFRKRSIFKSVLCDITKGTWHHLQVDDLEHSQPADGSALFNQPTAALISLPSEHMVTSYWEACKQRAKRGVSWYGNTIAVILGKKTVLTFTL